MRSDIVPPYNIARRTVLMDALGVLAAASSACGLKNYYVQEINVDAKEHLIPIGSKSLYPPAVDSYYWFFHAATGLTSVDHLAKQARSADPRRLLYLETDHQDALERTVKTDEVATGAFGALVVERTCFYNRPPGTYTSSVKILVQSLNPEMLREIPTAIPEKPVNVPPLTSISLVRFFRANSQLTFASGNYEANGRIGSIQTGKIVNGEIQPGSSIGPALATDFHEIGQTFGLPPQVEIENYLKSKRISLPRAFDPQEGTIIILGYGFGKLVRQDSLTDGVVISSRYMSPIVTKEESVLGPICDEHLRQQQSMGRSTVQ